jgi:hypothetical protein
MFTLQSCVGAVIAQSVWSLGYDMEDQRTWILFLAGITNSYLHSVQKGCGAHLAIQWVPATLSAVVRRPRFKSTTHLQLILGFRMCGAIPPLSYMSSSCGA